MDTTNNYHVFIDSPGEPSVGIFSANFTLSNPIPLEESDREAFQDELEQVFRKYVYEDCNVELEPLHPLWVNEGFIGQFIGFAKATTGMTAIGLVTDLNITKEQWAYMRDHVHLRDEDRIAIDEFFDPSPKIDLQLRLADSQLIGFGHASQGYDIVSLAKSMGLTKSEWMKLRDTTYLKQSDKDELDQHFKTH